MCDLYVPIILKVFLFFSEKNRCDIIHGNLTKNESIYFSIARFFHLIWNYVLIKRNFKNYEATFHSF